LPPTEPSSSVKLDATVAAAPDTPDAQETQEPTASPEFPALLELPDALDAHQLSARKSKSHHATHAHLAHPDHLDHPDHLATADDLDLPASPETTVNPAQPDPLAPTDLPDQAAQMDHVVTPDDQHNPPRTPLANLDQQERPAQEVCPATMALPDATDSPDKPDPTVPPDPLAPVAPTAKMAQLDPPANPAHRASAVSAPNTAPWTAVCSSKTEQDESKDKEDRVWPDGRLSPVVASFIDILRIAVILRCQQTISR
jgi:hypothetical protein